MNTNLTIQIVLDLYYLAQSCKPFTLDIGIIIFDFL